MPVIFNKKRMKFIGNIFISLLLMFLLVSCDKDDSVSTNSRAANLVIITDNDQGSYPMVKFLGKIYSSFPDINITYLQSKKFDVYEGAFLLKTAMQSFPEGTVFAGLVEPGAAGKRMVFQVGTKKVFVPDNTLATWALNESPGTVCYNVENSRVLGGENPTSLSFEDFYANAVCSLISGVQCSDFGTQNTKPAIFPIQAPVINGNAYLGQILFTDNFGNCTSNIPESLLASVPQGTEFTLKADTLQLKIKLGTSYSSVAAGQNVCFVNGSKLLELAVNYGNFSEKYGIKSGTRFQIVK